MPLLTKRWQVAPPVDPRHLARFPDLPPLLVQLLHTRGIDDPAAVRAFLQGGFTEGNPFQFKGMSEAVTRLRRAIKRGERIAVYGDFDTDGVTATALLVQVLTALGAQVEGYIPHRVDEGYGLNLEALRRLYRRGVRLVVTVDCGIRSVSEVNQARRGLDLIITDHHSVGRELPPATAIINPRQPDCRYPFKDLAGVGVAFKLAQALIRVCKDTRPPDLNEERWLDLVALGTVADLAPLLGENRQLVQRGLAALNQAARPGVAALMANAGVRRGEVDALAIGYRLGPRLNAAGRIDTAERAYRLLTSEDPLEVQGLAEELSRLNQQRQELTEETIADAEAQILAEDPNAPLFLAASPSFLPGIIGLAASRLSEAYYRPCVLVAQGETESRGSCRSIPEFHITAALDECADLLIRHGGHAAAAGFTVATANLPALHQRLRAIAADRLAGVELTPALSIDAEIPLDEVSWATHDLLKLLEPCGVGNPQPVLLSRGVQVRGRWLMGADQQHLRLALRDDRGVTWDAVLFRRASLLEQCPDRVDVVYTLEAKEWNGEKRLQLNIQDLRPTESPNN